MLPTCSHSTCSYDNCTVSVTVRTGVLADHTELTLNPTNNSDYSGHPYVFGVDPVSLSTVIFNIIIIVVIVVIIVVIIAWLSSEVLMVFVLFKQLVNYR